ncbi:unannotated protein [freshwater metagenome]|uniref:Unannotated protein n=1 Tax=freshwater metagenome TaxID=449393 RepID=A0A6J6S7K3_9ZZZZ
MSTRVAGTVDADSVRFLRHLARVHISQQRGGEVALLSDFADLEAPESNDAQDLTADRLVWLGCIDDVAVGYVSAQILQLTDGYALCQIREMFVESEAREIGVGELLMKCVIQWAQERGCGGIDATAMPGDRETKNFFETFGLVARAITVHQDLRGT